MLVDSERGDAGQVAGSSASLRASTLRGSHSVCQSTSGGRVCSSGSLVTATAGSEREHEPERRVDLSQLVVAQVPGGGSEPLGVHRRGVLDQHAGELA